MHRVDQKFSRYRQPRGIFKIDVNKYRVQGPALSYRVGEDFFDPEGGPWLGIGDNLGFGTITKIYIVSATNSWFVVDLEVTT